jgi:multidrug efflux pump subunit AcrA (membrane-fusion protein)
MCSNRKGILLILIASLLLSACQKQPAPASNTLAVQDTLKQQEEKYTLATVTKGTFTSEFSSNKIEVIYSSDEYVKSDLPAGKLKEILVKERSEVKKGDVLATLDMDVSMVDLEEMQLNYDRNTSKYQSDKKIKEDNLAKMRIAFSSMTDGYDKKIYELQIKKAELQYEQYIFQTGNSLKQQEKAIQEMIDKKSNNSIVAPFDGYILEVSHINPGDKVNPWDVICHIVSNEHLLLGVKENGLLRYNMEVKLTTRRLNEESVFTGRVVSAKNVMPADKWDDLTLIALDDPSKLNSLTGGKVTADFISLNNVFIVESKGISKDEDKNYVSLYEDGQISKRYVVIGKANKEFTWVLQGVSKDQSVIIK